MTMDNVNTEQLIADIAQTPPACDGYEPTAQEIDQIDRAIDNGTFESLPNQLRDLFRMMFLPSVMRYGTYPPPSIKTVPESPNH